MPRRIDPKILQAEIKLRIREFYPYFLGFYLLALVVAFFSKTWSSFFYWPAFHSSIVFFSLLFVLTFKFNFRFNRQTIIGFKENSFRETNIQFRRYFIPVYSKLSSLSRRTWLKIFIISVVLILALFKELGVLDFLVLFYALISVLFMLDSRWSAGLALVLLASCPILLIFNKDVLAEKFAIYVYYFLVITVLTQIREFKQDSKRVIGQGS